MKASAHRSTGKGVIKLFLCVFVLFQFPGCASSISAVKEGKKGVIYWATDTVPKRTKGGWYDAVAQNHYSLFLGILTYDPASPSATGLHAVTPKSYKGRESGSWYAATVDEGDYALAYLTEVARYRPIGLPGERVTFIGEIKKTSKQPDRMPVTDDMPRFHVTVGEAVYIGTFISKIEPKKGFFKSNTAAITRDYKVIPEDATGFGNQNDIPLDIQRTVNIFENNNRAWKIYTTRVVIDEE